MQKAPRDRLTVRQARVLIYWAESAIMRINSMPPYLQKYLIEEVEKLHNVVSFWLEKRKKKLDKKYRE